MISLCFSCRTVCKIRGNGVVEKCSKYSKARETNYTHLVKEQK